MFIPCALHNILHDTKFIRPYQNINKYFIKDFHQISRACPHLNVRLKWLQFMRNVVTKILNLAGIFLTEPRQTMHMFCDTVTLICPSDAQFLSVGSIQ